MVHRLDEELARELRPVSAPEELWNRIEKRIDERPASVVRWPLWALAAAVAAMVALFCFTLRSDTSSYMARFAVRELARGAAGVDFQSSDPSRIRAWVRANAGFDVPLPAGPPSGVRILGVSLFHGGALTACVTYRIGDQTAKLLVTGASASAPAHPDMQVAREEHATVSAWSMAGQTYTLASNEPANSQAACVLCHVDGKPAKRKA